MSHKQRIRQLERIQNKAEPETQSINVDWSENGYKRDPKTGETITDAEFLKRYPDSKIITWDDLPGD